MKCRVAIAGMYGRMGSTVADLAEHDPDVILVGGIVLEARNRVGHERLLVSLLVKEVMEMGDVLVDFTTPEGVITHLGELGLFKEPKAAVVGVTGFDESHMAKLEAASLTMPIVYDTNFSMGIALLKEAIASFGGNLKGMDMAIVETHRRDKKDAPSGTATDLAHLAARHHGRVPPISSLRLGEAPGEHRVFISNESEMIELTHRANSRAAFAKGALAAAKWVKGKKPGLYSFRDVFQSGTKSR
ncbi:MAG: dihydrodipicolinate reductase C-terminal domain-containing protein [Elusimicrobiota bacterium]